MRYKVSILIYLTFLAFWSYLTFAQGCSTSEKAVITGAACSIEELKKEMAQNGAKNTKIDSKNLENDTKNQKMPKLFNKNENSNFLKIK